MRPHREVHVDGSNHRPGDIYFPNWSNGKSLAVDVTVSHPSQGNPSMLASAEDNASLRSAEKAAKAKVTKHGPRCAAQNVTFLPLAVCAFGGWLTAGEEFVNTLAGRIAEVTGVRKSVATAQLWQRLSLTLWRSNAQAVLHNTPAADLWTLDVPGYAVGRSQ